MKPTTLKELFDHPSRWIKGALRGRRDGMGFVRTGIPDCEEPNCFCLLGGAIEVYGSPSPQAKRLREVITELFPQFQHSLVDFNNHSETTFADIRKVLEKANV